MRLAQVHPDQFVTARFHTAEPLAQEREGATNVLRSAAILSTLMLMLALLICVAT